MSEHAQVLQLGSAGYPASFARLPKPPTTIFYRGHLPELFQHPRVAIVGTRRPTAYGRQITKQLATQLAEQGIVIVSGLALGVDAIAHQAALDAGGLTLAVLPSPVTNIAPASNYQLSQRILKQGGALLSTYPPGQDSHKGNFVARNEYVAASSNIIVVTEADSRSGTRHTITFAEDQSVPVMAVPGNITSPMSEGTNNALRSRAHVVTSANDVLHLLGLPRQTSSKPIGDTPEQQQLLDLISTGTQDGFMLLERSGLNAQTFNQTLTMLEISAKITALGGNQWSLA